MKIPPFNQKFGTDFGEDLIGTVGRDQLYGFGGNDRLYGMGGDDQLYGGAGNDLLDGGTGADVMDGGSGDDLYRVDNLADIVSEQSVPGVDEGGTDTVESTITYSLPTLIEKLTLKGTAAINGTGNELANRLAGNDSANVLSGRAGDDIIYGYGGADMLIGGAGKDELWGGTASDTFVFNFPDPTSTDRVKDFSGADHDHIGVYASDYGLSLGHGLVDGGTGTLVLDSAYFVAVAGSASAVQGTSLDHGQFVFSSTASTHTLMWDADGAGPSHGVALATFNLDATPSAADFSVFTTPPTVTVKSAPDPAPQRADALVGFTIDLSIPTNEDVLLTYSTIDGTAVAGSNFVGVSHGQVVIPAGSTSATVLVNVLDHDVQEPVELFNLHVELAVGVATSTAFSIANSTASGSIAPLAPSVVAITDTAAFGSQDPFGLTYVPGSNTLFMCDPQNLSYTNNLFALNLDGSLKSGGVSSLSFGFKPAGLAFDPTSGRMYIADDDLLKIQWVDPANPTRELGEFSAKALGSTDTEDVAVNPNNGHVFIVNGGDFGAPKIIETDSIGSQIFSTVDLTTAVQGQPVGSPEAVAYDAAHDVFFVAGNNYDIKVVNRSGAVLDDMTFLSNYRNPVGNIGVEIQGLTLAPSSDPNDDPAKLNLYVADAGLLNGNHDGRLIEIDLHGGLLFA